MDERVAYPGRRGSLLQSLVPQNAVVWMLARNQGYDCTLHFEGTRCDLLSGLANRLLMCDTIPRPT